MFALRQAFSNVLGEDPAFVLACLGLAALLLWDSWPKGFSLWGAGQMGLLRLRYEEDGRSGRIHVTSGRARFEMYWEFGGGEALAIINVPTEAEWSSCTGVPVAQREPLLRAIATQVIRDKTSTGRNRYAIGPDHITIYE